MKTIYVIGAGGTGSEAIERARKVLELKEDVKIVCVDNMEDVPLKERLSSAPTIQRIHKLVAPPFLPISTHFYDKKRKGHERPYKFHP